MRLGDVVPAQKWVLVLLSGALFASACRFGYEILPERNSGGSGGSAGVDDSGGNSGIAGSGSGGDPACDDGIANGTESDVDCGGDCMPCTVGNTCRTADDCLSSICDGDVCAHSSCTDEVRNQGETDVDCGGPVCPCCNPGAFGAPEQITGLGLTGNLYGPALSPDTTTLYFSSIDGDENIYAASRPDRGVAFSEATLVSELNGSSNEGTPYVSADGLSLYFYSDRMGSLGGRDLMVASRNREVDAFSAPSWLANVNSIAIDQAPSVSPDELRIVLASSRAGGVGEADLWLAKRNTTSEDFSEPVNLAELNTEYNENGPSLSSDELTLYFVSNRPGSQDNDVWVATRPDPQSPFEDPVTVDAVNSEARELDPFISRDGRELFFASNVSGSWIFWRSIRDCL